MADQDTPLEQLGAAVQEFATDQAEAPVMVAGALVVWEQVRFDDDGAVLRSIHYTVPTDGATLSGCLGLLEAAAGEFVRRDVLGSRCDQDDD